MGLDYAFWETRPDPYLPYHSHIGPNVLLHTDGSVSGMLCLSGFPFELEDDEKRNVRRRQLNKLLSNISDDNVTLWMHFLRYEEKKTPVRNSPGFSGRLADKYTKNCLSGLMRNEWLVTVVVSPRFVPAAKFTRMKKTTPQPSATTLDELENTIFLLKAYLSKWTDARRLGLREDKKTNRVYSEIGEKLQIILSGRYEPIEIKDGPLGPLIYQTRAVCGTRGVRLEPSGTEYYARIHAMREYPEESRVSQLANIMRSNVGNGTYKYPCVLTQSLRFQLRIQAQRALTNQRVRMQNAQDEAIDDLEEIAKAKSSLGSGDEVRGTHHLSFTAFAPDGPTLDEVGSDAKALLVEAGASPVLEGLGCFGAYWSQLPGSQDWLKTRPAQITSKNLLGMASLDGFPAGDRRGHWGRPLIRFRTTADTPYDYTPHVGQVGHTLFIGRTRSGKTVTMSWINVALVPVVAETGGFTVTMDKDRSNEIAIRALGGRYMTPRPGHPTGWAPLRALPNTDDACAFLTGWLERLIRLDEGKPLLPAEQKRLARGVERVMELPVHKRWVATVRQYLPWKDSTGVGARLDRWCHDGALGWMFDNEHDEFPLDRPANGVDMTYFLDHFALPAIAEYKFYRIRENLNGKRRVAVSVDEALAYLKNKAYAEPFDDFARRMAKLNGILFLASQQPEDFIDSPIGAGLMSQFMTKFLFPQETIKEEKYRDGLACTEAEVRAVVELMPSMSERHVLLKRESGSVILKIELKDMDDEIAVLSGNEQNVRILDEVREEVGDDPSVWLPIFLRRVKDEKALADRRYSDGDGPRLGAGVGSGADGGLRRERSLAAQGASRAGDSDRQGPVEPDRAREPSARLEQPVPPKPPARNAGTQPRRVGTGKRRRAVVDVAAVPEPKQDLHPAGKRLPSPADEPSRPVKRKHPGTRVERELVSATASGRPKSA